MTGSSSHSLTAISLTEEYRLLHEVAKALQMPLDLPSLLQEVMRIITGFDELKVESKAGVFRADPERQVLRLFATYGKFSDEFLENEKEVPYGSCLCGRAAVSGELVMSDSCFTDERHERTFTDMTPHGHYIIPLKSRSQLVGVLFLYTQTAPSWYRHSQELLLSIGSLIADVMERREQEDELARYRDQLEEMVRNRTADLESVNRDLQEENRRRAETEEQLTQTRESLRLLNQRVQTVQEEERRRISREVHDELGQSLTALALDLAWIRKRIDQPSPELQSKIEEMGLMIQDTLRQTQKIATQLRPNVLDTLGLGDALRWQAREFSERNGIPCDLEIDPAGDGLEVERSTTIFRIFQEALTNISRHAKANRVTARFQKRKDGFFLEIIDDGCGLPEEKLKDPKSLGLMNIQERALALGGRVDFFSELNAGTTVQICIPKEANGH